MSQNDLLIRHAVKWAQSRSLTLDPELLETVLDLRDFHDEQRPQAWPSGSAEHLMLVRWPSHGPSEVPEPERLVTTLETFWKFLRGSGRMAAGSADPKSLTKEARRAAPRMAEAAADPARHGASKGIIEFGRSIGITLDDVASMEEAQARLDQITRAWNDLPVEERRRLSPGPSAHQGSLPGRQASDFAQALATGRFDDDHGWDLGDLDEASDEPMPRKDPAVVARQVQQSPFVQQVLRLANWVGEGRAVTATGVLRLAEARAAYEDLGLRAYEARRQAARYSWLADRGGTIPEPDDVVERMRSAADLASLDRLWQAAQTAKLVDVGRTKARQVPVEGRTVEEWGQLGMVTLTALFLTVPQWSGRDKIAFTALLLLLAHGRTTVTDLEDWWWEQPANYLGNSSFPHVEDEEEREYLRLVSDRAVTSTLEEFADTGVWRRAGDTLHQTDLGYEFALVLASLKDQGLLDEDD